MRNRFITKTGTGLTAREAVSGALKKIRKYKEIAGYSDFDLIEDSLLLVRNGGLLYAYLGAKVYRE